MTAGVDHGALLARFAAIVGDRHALADEAGKAPYLRTYADHVWNDNLLALAECGANCRIVG